MHLDYKNDKTILIMNMKKLSMCFAAILMMAAVSCNKEEISPDVPSGVSFTATTELSSTRTAIDGEGNVTWTVGDQVAFYWQVDKALHEGESDYPYISEALTEGGEPVKFTIANPSQTFVDAFINNIKTDNGRNLYAIYPSTVTSSYYTATGLTGLDVNIPVEQDGTFEKASISMAKWATATPTSLQFYNLCALLKLTVGDDVKKIVVKSDSDIAGQMYITFKDGDVNVDYPVIYKTGETSKEITVNVNGAGSYYVAVRPTVIENLYVECRGENDVLIAGQTAGRALDAKRATIYSLPTISTPSDKLFVKVDGTGDGSSWDNAMNMASLISYLTNSDNTEPKNVYMAAGTFTTTVNQIYPIKTGYKLYGGFPATATGYDLTGRDVKANATNIDGAWDGTSTETNNRLFVIQKGAWVFDGLNFQNVRYSGNAHGSAIQVITSDGVTISNCTFTNCVNANENKSGGVVRIDAGNTVDMISCTFTQNSAQNGGAIYVAGNLNAVGCDFVKNAATVSGGAILADGAAVVKLDKCEFSQNTASGEVGGNGGGAICLEKDSTAKLFVNRCSFVKNTDKYNAHHIYTRSTDNYVGINNSVFRGPYGVATTAGGLVQLKGHSVIVNTTMYGRTTKWGAISLGSKTENGCRIINNIVLNNSSNGLSFYTTDYSASIYNTIYTDSAVKEGGEGVYKFVDCLSGAYARKTGDNLANFPTAETAWSLNDEIGTKFRFEDGRSFYAYAWEGTTEVGEVKMTSLAAIKELISGTANVGTEFLTWLESDELKVNGVEALAVDIRGEARDTDNMWPGSYQAPLVVSQPEAGAESFNVK